MEDITYEKFIQNILDTRGRFGCGEEYHERHHITPRCMDGLNNEENLIDLFAREHFEAHRLLALEHPDNDKLQYAWGMMAHIGRVKISPEEYEEARIAHNKALSESRKGKYVGENNPNYGNYWTEEQKQHMSKMNSNPSQETRDKMSASQKQRFKDPNVRAFYSGIMKERFSNIENHPNYGKHLSNETKEKIRNKAKERLSNPENCPNYGRPMSEEAKRKGNETRRNNHIGEKITIQLTLNDEIIKVFWSGKQVKHELGINDSDISKCCNRKLKSAGGYHWKYLYDNQLKNGEIIPGAITLGLITEEDALNQLKENKMINEKE